MDTTVIIELIKAFFLGLVEGVTEWLPVSSTGHMILLEEFVKLDVSEAFWNLFLVVVQLGAILAVCVLYFSRLNPFSLKKTHEQRLDTWVTWGKIVVGVIPAAVAGVFLDDFMEEHLSTWYVVAVALIVYGVVFIVIERWRRRRLVGEAQRAYAMSRPAGAHYAEGPDALPADEEDLAISDPGIQTMRDLSWGKAFGIGCFQILSLVPGTSRSGSTIIGGLLLGCSRTLAAEYSFFMAIPVMFGASALRLVKFLLADNAVSSIELDILVVGIVVAFMTSIFSIRFLMRFIKTNDFQPFGVNRIVLGIVVIAYFLLAH